ncbi:PucR family transcriptional regulator [Streptomyces sp. NPDC101118]|uniref:PucR family transcriptional regulator n=1 Tax=Streptomyces sp. NPDC101118 TaxID=3366109 RepID=UPI0038043F9C
MERIIEEIRGELAGRVARTADELAARLLAEDPAYAALLDHEELFERIHRNLRQALEGMELVARGLPPVVSDAAATGTLRARQGLPLASLLNSYRRGGRMLWGALTETVAAHDPAALPRLLPAAAILWDVLERMTDAVTASYRLIEADRAARDQERRHALLDALLDGTGTATGLVSEAAAGLGLPERGRFAVVVLATDGTGPGRPVPEAGAAGPRVLWRLRADREVGLVELGAYGPAAVRELLAPLGVRAGVSPVVGSAGELARARWLAELALRTTAGAGVPETAVLDERLPAALVAAQGELADRLRAVVLGPVLALAPEDGRVLLSTLGAWLAAGGSAAEAARRLFCHRNTVSNRLRRLETLTGRSLADPAQVVELALAHAAVTLRGTGGGPEAGEGGSGSGLRGGDRA